MTSKKVAISIKLDSLFRDQLTTKAKNQDLSLSAYIRKCIESYDQNNTQYDLGNTDYIETLKQQLDKKDQQIDELLKQSDQHQQIIAHSQKQETERQKQLVAESWIHKIKQIFNQS
jgi:hemerythrin-like domain-containing protein